MSYGIAAPVGGMTVTLPDGTSHPDITVLNVHAGADGVPVTVRGNRNGKEQIINISPQRAEALQDEILMEDLWNTDRDAWAKEYDNRRFGRK